MAGLSPKLQLIMNEQDGYALNKTYVEVVKQNFVNLLLTVPGERIMDPDFGVGMRTFLFELDNIRVRSEISGKIYQQAGKYIPFIEIRDISFTSQIDDPAVSPNLLFIKITYVITPLNFVDRLDISIPNN